MLVAKGHHSRPPAKAWSIRPAPLWFDISFPKSQRRGDCGTNPQNLAFDYHMIPATWSMTSATPISKSIWKASMGARLTMLILLTGLKMFDHHELYMGPIRVSRDQRSVYTILPIRRLERSREAPTAVRRKLLGTLDNALKY